jgi:hypothetical protein
LQQERRLSLVYPTTGSDADRQALEAPRRETDQLATRMRRNAENLVVLSGAVPGRAWRQPVPVVDLVRDMLAEDYTRVTVLAIEPAQLAGRAVGDLTHPLAELLENAVSFSPPHTPVQLTASASHSRIPPPAAARLRSC